MSKCTYYVLRLGLCQCIQDLVLEKKVQGMYVTCINTYAVNRLEKSFQR